MRLFGKAAFCGVGEDGTHMGLRVLLASTHPLVLDGIRATLEPVGDIEVVADAETGAEALSLIEEAKPDVVLLDSYIVGPDVFTCLSTIRAQHPDVVVLALSDSRDAGSIVGSLRRGAHGCVLKSINPVDLASALRQAVDGTVYYALDLSETEEGAGAAALSERELTILRAVARGLSNNAIGRELWVTEQTVKFRLTSIYRKLGVANRTEAARYAYRNGLVETPAAA